jgi:glutamate--cysteine ligase catalytic subunit
LLAVFVHYRYDLMVACKDIGLGRLHVPELLGDVHIDPVTTEGAYGIKLDSKRVQNSQLLALLRRYTDRESFSGGAL